MILCLILTFCMGAGAGTAAASEFYVVDTDFAYPVNGGSIYCNEYGWITGADIEISGDIVIPDEINGVTVTAIGYYAFSLCENITSVTVPDTVTSLWPYSFDCCVNMEKISLPEGLNEICANAFYHCEGLKSIEIPSTVKYIDNYAFAQCENLKDITFPNGNDYFVMTEKGLMNAKKTRLIFYPEATSATSVTVPSNLRSFEGAYSGNGKLKAVTIPASDLKVSDDAFSWCDNLSDVTIKSGIQTIGSYAFYGDTALKSVTIPSSVTEIEYYAFATTGLRKVTLPSKVNKVGDGAFAFCHDLTSVTFSSIINKIPESVCDDCYNLTAVSIPSSVSEINYYAFRGCKNLSSLTLNSGLRVIKGSAFEDCDSLRSVSIPMGTTEIGYQAFGGCDSLKAVKIPTSVSNINYFAFMQYNWFSGDWEGKDPVIYGTRGSYAEEYAEDMGYTFKTMPGKPTIYTKALAGGKIRVTWTKKTGAYKYQVYRSTSKTGTYKLVKTTTDTKFVNTGLKAGQTYYYKVRCVASGCSDFKSSFSAIKYSKAKA